LLGIVGLGCLVGCSDPASQSGSGGHGGSGGATGSGGGTSSGGATGSGGITSTGGATGSGGITSSGGAPASSGGTTGSGGAGSGAPTGSGGTTGSGGDGPGGKTGSGGAAGGPAAGTGGGAAGGNGDGWVSILPIDDTLKDARGVQWFPYVEGFPTGTDTWHTFRRDPQTGYLVVTYADYPNQDFTAAVSGKTGNHLGQLYYDKKLTNYKVRIEYQFQTPQAEHPVSWGKNNSGIMVFGTDPHALTNNPEIPAGIEIQILGSPSAGGSVNCQICNNSMPGVFSATYPNSGCFTSKQKSQDFQLATAWVTVEADVSATGTTNIYQYGQDGTKPATPIQSFAAPIKTGGQTLTSAWMSLQSESQPITFRKVELIELP
jgi:hypothetical protein